MAKTRAAQSTKVALPAKRMPRPINRTWPRRLAQHIIGNELLLAATVTLLLIIVGIGFGWENNKLVPVNPVTTAHYTQAATSRLDFLANWDGRDYLAIAQHGYAGTINTNFFPLYPLLIRIVNTVVGSRLYSGLLISWASLVGAIYFYLKIIKRLYKLEDNLEALRGVLFFVLFPTAVFLLAVYTESLFAFLALGAVYFALSKRYLPAALLGLLATATHVNGLFVLVFVALLLLEQRERLLKIVAGLVIGSLGLIAYMAYLQIHFHKALAFVSSQKSNGWLHYGLAHIVTVLVSRKGVFLLLVAVSAVYWWNRRRSFSIYSWLYVAIALLGGLGGYGRYALMAFPLQLMFYDYFRNKKLGYPLVLAVSAIFWTYFLLQFAGGYSGG